ncbi:unnamed protein product [Schistocephalus solidus]|uniref:Mediator of RNA polymerase II transcription subunit 1 n=1 Tax=Schistocephalus solidus TaxID=70667 RepID=A0A183TJP8_SCHSO|nr:unnamed protein product [Schistocephalus solidus]
MSLSVDEQLLANETTARLLYAQALTDLRATLHWCHTNVPLYGCMPIHFCLTDLADPKFESELNSNATISTQLGLRPADVYVGRDAIRVVLTGPFLTGPVSTTEGAEHSLAPEVQQHSTIIAESGATDASGDGTVMQQNVSAANSSDAFLLLNLPLIKIRSWQLITPEVDSDSVFSRLVIQYAGRNLLSRGLHAAVSIPKTAVKSLPEMKQRDASVIITELPVPLPFVEMDDDRLFEILGNLSLVRHVLR